MFKSEQPFWFDRENFSYGVPNEVGTFATTTENGKGHIQSGRMYLTPDPGGVFGGFEYIEFELYLTPAGVPLPTAA